MASATQHADVAQGHLLVFSPEAQPISEPGVGEACLDVGLTVLSRGEGGPPPRTGAPFAAFPSEMFQAVPCSLFDNKSIKHGSDTSFTKNPRVSAPVP